MSKFLIEVDLSGWPCEKITAVYVAREDGQQHLPDFRIVTQPSAEPVAWLTDESLRRLSRGGNSRGSVPVHASRSYVAKTPVYLHPSPADEAVRRDAERQMIERCAALCDELDQDENTDDYRHAARWCAERIRMMGDDVDAAIDAAIAQRGEV
jgi:hypothetical protein